jgi:SNF2 family DNA or RNA helicase
MEIKLWEHQRRAIERAKELPHLALFWCPGVGKTLTTIRIVADKYNKNKRVMKTLIIAPVIVLDNWKREFKLFCPKLPQERIFILHGNKKEKILQECLDLKEGQNIIVTNFETLLNEKIRNQLHAWGPEILVVDESQRIKNPTSKRTKHVYALSENTKHRYILSGTPILNSPMDIYAQFKVLDGGQTFGKNFFAFRATYFYDKNAGMPAHNYFPDWRERPEMMPVLNEKINRLADRAIKEECLDLPELVRQKIYVQLTPAQRKVYNELKQDFVSYVESSAVVADLAITKALRLQQIVSGYCKLEDDREFNFEDTPRVQALSELLEDITEGNKVIVWAVFKQNYHAIRKVCEKLKIKYVEATGETPAKQKFANVDAFNNDPEVKVFIGHPGALGVGINLKAASYSIYYSRNFSLENQLQSEARNYRGGSIELHDKITQIDLIAADTIDQDVVEALERKEKVADTILSIVKGSK